MTIGVVAMTDSDFEIVRDYVPGIIADITRLHVEYYHQHWGTGREFEVVVARDVASFIQRYDEAPNGIWSVNQAGQVVGAIIIDGAIEAGHNARLRYFIVGDTARGKGIGRRLMQLTMDFCDEQGFEHVYLKTVAGLKAAIYLYETFGFVVVKCKVAGDVTELFYERSKPNT